MPTPAKHLFRPEALRPRLASFNLTKPDISAVEKLKHWASLLAGPQADKLKETELLPEFLNDVFLRLLGYWGPASGHDRYTMKREPIIQAAGEFADAAVGAFSVTGHKPTIVAAVEGKGPRDPLDRPFSGRKRSAVEQALLYAVNAPCEWYIVTNLREIRLYHKGHDQFTFERFELAALAADANALRRFVFLLGAERVVGPDGKCHLNALLTESRDAGRRVTCEVYREYSELRTRTFDQLRAHNPSLDPLAVLGATQKMLDRVLFVAFAEDRGLLPAGSINKAHSHRDPYNPRPLYDNFKGLFRAVDLGEPTLNIDRYNGGLFAPDPLLDNLIVPDDVCHGFKALAAYDYGSPLVDEITGETAEKLVDVEILGHIFEQSISDLEEIRKAVASGQSAGPSGPSKRKREGAFYTPEFVTRYIVGQTLGPVLADRFERLRTSHYEMTAANLRGVLKDPNGYDGGRSGPASEPR